MLNVFWADFKELIQLEQIDKNHQLRRDKMKGVLQDILPIFTTCLSKTAFTNSTSVRIASEIEATIGDKLEVDFLPSCNQSLAAAQKWAKDESIVWDNYTHPKQEANFVYSLKRYFPEEAKKPAIQRLLTKATRLLIEKAKSETEFSDYVDYDNAEEQSNGYESLADSFQLLGKVRFGNKSLTQELHKVESWFRRRVRREDEDEFEDESSGGTSSSIEVNINQLFRDL